VEGIKKIVIQRRQKQKAGQMIEISSIAKPKLFGFSVSGCHKISTPAAGTDYS
jgi:hypothetical protein